jgi:hypothetical protein
VSRAPAFAANVALGSLVLATTIGLVGYHALGPAGRIAIALVAFGSFGAVFLPATRPYALTPRRVMLTCGVLIAVAVLTPVRGSHDLWSYANYGRILSADHASPFTHVPADFPHDPLLHLVAHGWRHTGSVYGPGFVALAAAGSSLTGSSVLANRLLFQGLEAAALALALGVVWRRTRDPAAVALLGLNPAVLAAVNGGHNDILVGLALLGGTVLIADRRPNGGGVALALGALVKLVLLLPIAALLIWAWHQRGARAALRAGATCGAVIVGAYLLAGGTAAFGPLLHASGQRSRSSIWQLPTRLLLHPMSIQGPGVASVIGSIALLTIAVVATEVVTGAVRTRFSTVLPRDARAAVIAGATTLVFLFGASYVLPWYSAWSLPLLALGWRTRVAAVAAAQSVLVALAYLVPIGAAGLFDVYAKAVVPVCSLCLLVYIVASARRGRLADPITALPTSRRLRVDAEPEPLSSAA